MAQSRAVSLERLTPHIAKVTFSNPPANLIAPETVSRLHDIVLELSEGPDIQQEVLVSHFLLAGKRESLGQCIEDARRLRSILRTEVQHQGGHPISR